MFRELFYYLLGGLTFLPLCLVSGCVYFYLTCPRLPADDDNQSIPSDLDLTQQRKVEALDLAAANAAIHAELERSKGVDQPEGSSTAPPTAKRLGPQPQSSSSRPHLSGWLTVRPRFETAPIPNPKPGPTNGGMNGTGTAAGGQDTSTNGDQQAPTADAKGSLPPSASAGYMSQMYKGIMQYRNRTGGKRTLPPAPTSEAANNETTAADPNKPSTGSSAGASSAASAATSSQAAPTGTAGKEQFHCILKAPILYLYSSDDISNPSTECHAAIDLRGKRVSIFVAGFGDTLGEFDTEDEQGNRDIVPRPQNDRVAAAKQADATNWDTQSSADNSEAEGANANRHKQPSRSSGWGKARRAAVRDGELFMRRNAIRIVGSAPSRSSQLSPAVDGDRTAHQRRPQWFIFCKNTVTMEDWYHSLIQASLMPETTSTKHPSASSLPSGFTDNGDPVGPMFSKEDMSSLLTSLDSYPDPIPLRWLNALVGRIFFSVYRTAWLEDYITRKMMKKISRVRTPGFLGDIRVQEVDIGRRAPGFSRPMLKTLTSEGEASMEVASHYSGEIRITISTTLTISLGSRFKPYTIPLVLAVVLRSLEGNLLLHVKPPPSNRLWFGFTALPKMEIDVEPVVSERKVQWGMVTRLIEGRIRELLNESLVVPNMDDVPFFDSRASAFRGGIFADAAKRSDSSVSAAVANTLAAEEPTNLVAPEASKRNTAKSAPVSGAATPDNEGSAITTSMQTTDETNKGDTATLRNRKTGEGRQTLEPAHQQSSATLSSSPSASNLSGSRISPAAAGLSDLLSRDLAASGERLTVSPSRSSSGSSQQQHQKRKSWFGTAPRLSSGSSMSSILPSQTSGRSGREQSSLAWGNASLSNLATRPSSSGSSTYEPRSASIPASATASASMSPTPQDGGLATHMREQAQNRPDDDALSATDDRRAHSHERNKKSVSSISSSVLGTDESGVSASTDQLNASLEAATIESLGLNSRARASRREKEQDREAEDDGDDSDGKLMFPIDDATSLPTPTIKKQESSSAGSVHDKAPEVMVSQPSEPSLVDSASGMPRPDSDHGTAVNSSEDRSLTPLQTDRIVPNLPATDSPSSLTGSSIRRQSSGSSLRSTETRTTIEAGSDAFGASSDRLSVSAQSTGATSTSSGAATSPQTFAPPPRRTLSTSRDLDSSRHSEAVSALNQAQQSRYGLSNSPSSREAGSMGSGLQNLQNSATAAALLSSWNKAKASMADKESRQAAAKDAKDAIKRGWATWNAKRTDKNGGNSNAQTNDNGFHAFPSSSSSSLFGGRSNSPSEAVSSSRSSRLSLLSGQSDWLRGKTPDPDSLGLGIDGQSPEDSRHDSDLRRLSSEAEWKAYLRKNLGSSATGAGDDGDDNASVRSSSSGRQSYRDLRASKVAQQRDGSRVSDAGGERSSAAAMQESPWSAQWDAKVPTLSAPAPAFQRPAEKGEQHSRSASNERTGFGTDIQARRTSATSLNQGLSQSPPDSRRRRISSSANSGGSGGSSGGVSFMPAAPYATTGLASATGLTTDANQGISGNGNSATGWISQAQPAASIAAPSRAELGEKARATAGGVPSSQSPPQPQGSPTTIALPPRPKPKVAKAEKPETATSPRMHTSPRLYAEELEGKTTPPAASPFMTQPGRAAMMAVPGIPSMQKAGPQSFSATPPPEEASPARASGPKIGSILKLPAFGSQGTATAGKASSISSQDTKAVPTSEQVANETSTHSAEKSAAAAVPAAAAVVDEDEDASEAEEHATLKLSTTNDDKASEVAIVEDARAEVAPQATNDQSLVKKKEGEEEEEDKPASFAEVAAAEGPAADEGFSTAQIDTGAEAVQVPLVSSLTDADPSSSKESSE